MEFGSKVKCITIMWEKKKTLVVEKSLKKYRFISPALYYRKLGRLLRHEI